VQAIVFPAGGCTFAALSGLTVNLSKNSRD